MTWSAVTKLQSRNDEAARGLGPVRPELAHTYINLQGTLDRPQQRTGKHSVRLISSTGQEIAPQWHTGSPPGMSWVLQGSEIESGFFHMQHGPVHTRKLYLRAQVEVGEGAQPRRRGRGKVRGGWR
jgi:hypothetical protein